MNKLITHISSAAALVAMFAAVATDAAFAQSSKQPESRPGAEQRAPDAKPDPGKPGSNGPKDKGKPKDQGRKDDAKPDGTDPQAEADPKKAQPKPPQTAEEKSRLLGDLYAQLATADDEETALKHAAQIERLWKFSGSDTVALLLQRAAAAMHEKRHALAQKLLDHAVSLAPDYPEAFNQRAYLHYSLNDYDAAVGDLRRVLALDPNHYKALEGLAQIWRDSGNKKGALGVMKQLIDVHPFVSGGKSAYEELKREVDGQGI